MRGPEAQPISQALLDDAKKPQTERIYAGVKVMHLDETNEACAEARDFIMQIVEYLDERFPMDNADVNSLSALNFAEIPTVSERRTKHRREDIPSLALSFGLDAVAAADQWIVLKIHITERIQDYTKYDANTLMTMTLRDEALIKKIPEMAKLIQIVLSMPVSMSICERGFSAQNVVKTIKRTRLNDYILEGCFASQQMGLHRSKWTTVQRYSNG